MTTNDILKIASFAFNSDLTKFQDIFGEELGEHLYTKWKYDYKDNFLVFFNGGLDNENKDKLASYIN